MIKHSKVWALILLCSLLAACAKEPSNQALEERFYSNEAKFDELIKMATQDKIGDKVLYSISRTNYEESKLPQVRWNDYQKVFNEIGIESLFQKENKDIGKGYECIILLAYSEGLAIGRGGSYKGYAYCNKPVEPTYRYQDQHGVHETTFKKLHNKWYLYTSD